MSNEQYDYEKIERNGFTAVVQRDEDPLSPDEMGDGSVGYVVGWHCEFKPRLDRSAPYDGEHVRDYLNDAFNDDVPKSRLMEDYGSLLKGYWVFPLNAYIHSGVVLELDERRKGFRDRHWDVSNWFGAVLVNKKEFRIRAKALKFASELVDEWNQYMSGDVHTVSVIKDGETLDSCGGFYGTELALGEANRMLDYEIEAYRKRREARLKTLVSNRVPLDRRLQALRNV
jgi:hypothetical protein